MTDTQLQKILKQLNNHENRINKLEYSADRSVLNKNLPKIKMAMSEKINFDMSERSFIQKYSKGFSGPKKFVLILVYLVQGEIKKEKSIVEIKNHWNKMTSLLKKKRQKGKFNPYYSIRAKDNNWVDSKKYGFFHLTDSWMEIFSKK